MELTRRFYKYIVFKDCWEWQGSIGSSGYGRISINSKQWLAHRYSYTLFIGDIPDDLVIDHLCRNKICVNPAHLEVVEHGENTRRGEVGLATGRKQRAKTHCPKGHLYAGSNILKSSTGRRCRACQNERSREYQRKKRSAII